MKKGLRIQTQRIKELQQQIAQRSKRKFKRIEKRAKRWGQVKESKPVMPDFVKELTKYD